MRRGYERIGDVMKYKDFKEIFDYKVVGEVDLCSDISCFVGEN